MVVPILLTKNYLDETLFFSFKNPQAKELNITFEVYSSETCINISNNLLYKDIDPNNWHYFTLDIFLNIPKNHQRKIFTFWIRKLSYFKPIKNS